MSRETQDLKAQRRSDNIFGSRNGFRIHILHIPDLVCVCNTRIYPQVFLTIVKGAFNRRIVQKLASDLLPSPLIYEGIRPKNFLDDYNSATIYIIFIRGGMDGGVGC